MSFLRNESNRFLRMHHGPIKLPSTLQAHIACYLGLQQYPIFQTNIRNDKSKQSQFTCFCKFYVNQTYTNGSGMILGVRIAKFRAIRHLVQELITFLFIFGSWILQLVCIQDLSIQSSWFNFNLFGTWTCLKLLLETLYTEDNTMCKVMKGEHD